MVPPVLCVENLCVSYDRAVILRDVNLMVHSGEVVGLVGPNGAGKSTLLRAISGLVTWDRDIQQGTQAGKVSLSGEVLFNGNSIMNSPAHQIAQQGLIHCPERRRPFRELTVQENLLAGAYQLKDSSEAQENLETVHALFPLFEKRASQLSGTLSGGEQQMLAIGRSLMGNPKLLCIDEPSTGLSPKIRREVFDKIKSIQNLGVTILLVEQEVQSVFEMASRSYVLSSGHIVAEGESATLLDNHMVRKTYFGL